MTFRPEEWARVKELFEGALALAPSQRSSFIASACGDDDALRRQVQEARIANFPSLGGGFIQRMSVSMNTCAVFTRGGVRR